MSDLLGVTVEELVSALKRRRARLPFEIGAFVALELCEYLLQGPAIASPADVRITDEGNITAYAPPNSASGAEAARSVVHVLAQLLVAAGQGVPPGLLRLVESGPEDGRWDLARLRDELEASLVPLNRAAARRVLARLIRETKREPTEARHGAVAAPAEDDLDADLDELLGQADAPAPQPSGAVAASSAFGVADDDDAPTARRPGPAARHPARAPGASGDAVPHEDPPPASEAAAADAAAAARPPSDPPDEAPPAPVPARAGGSPSSSAPAHDPVPSRDPLLAGIEEEAAGPRRSRGWPWLLLFAALIGALVGTVLVFRPDAIQRLLGQPVPQQAAAAERIEQQRAERREQMLAEHRQKFGELNVQVQPEHAQVFLFVGRGPAEAHDLPAGVAHEFVALADGKQPSRAVVPQDAEWDESEQGLRYELAMQAGDEPVPFDDLEIGASKLPRDVGRPSGQRGSVRIVTNPRGAKVYLLVGFGPQVTVQDLRTDEAHELLIAHEGHEPERVVLGQSDWDRVEQRPAASLYFELEER